MKIVLHPVGDNPPEGRLYYGQHVLATLRSLPDGSVQCVCTSPPFWGLRDYGGEPPVWGDADCQHEWQAEVRQRGIGGDRDYGSSDGVVGRSKPAPYVSFSGTCTKCNAWRGHLGLEPTPQMFVDHLVVIFREVRRVLRDDGVLFLNLGDSYFGSSTAASNHKNLGRDMVAEGRWPADKSAGGSNPNHKNTAWPAAKADPEAFWHLKPKDLVGIPWMVAFALRSDGWYLRSDIVWSKQSCMPESVRDRPTRAHEYIFLLTKSERYFYDADAIREASFCANRAKDTPGTRATQAASGVRNARDSSGGVGYHPSGRNKRTVWTINPKPYPGAHFATWPPELVELMVKAGTSQHGACAACGAPYQRVVERDGVPRTPRRQHLADMATSSVRLTQGGGTEKSSLGAGSGGDVPLPKRVTTGWEPTCGCRGEAIVPCAVLDPFSGSATTGAVAMRLGRNYIGCDLQPDYLELAVARLDGRKAPVPDTADEDDLIGDLFG